MAVDETTESVEETTSSEPEVDLEDIEVSPEELGGEFEDDDEAEASDTEDDTELEDEAEEDEEEESTEEAEPEVTPADEAKTERARNKEMAEKRLQAKAEREAQLKQQQADYVAEADTDDPRDLAVRQLQVDAYNNKVDSNTNKLTNGYERALKDFDILRSTDPVIQNEVNNAVDAFQAQHVSIDQFGNPIDVTGDLYAYLQTKADSIAQLTGLKVKQQEKSKSREKSKTLSTPSRAPKEAKKDPDLEAFDEEAWR